MTSLTAVTAHLDAVLKTREFPDYPGALNGLQVASESDICKIAAAVDCSVRTIEAAVAIGATLLLVHHGVFWGGLQPLRGIHYRRLRALLVNDIALYSSHLPLDAHPTFGNNVLLARKLGLEPTAPFAYFGDVAVGVRGDGDIATSELLTRAQAFAHAHGGSVRISAAENGRRTHRWAVCSGAGASADTLREASSAGIDTLIVGEGPHYTAVDAADASMTIIYAGHYATETLGIQALAEHVSATFHMPWEFVEAPTGL